MTANNLNDQRLQAALDSHGISSSAIYTSILNLMDLQKVSGPILDFGAGIGQLSQLLVERQDHPQVTAIDMAQFDGAFQHSRLKWLYSDLNQRAPIDDGIYGTIVSCEVIEHLENPRAVAREWLRLLKPGGTLILSTPNNESWRAILSLIFRGHFAYFTDASYPAHITALLQTDLQRILSEAGFRDIAFSFTNDGGIPKMPHITWQSISCGVLAGSRFSDNLLCTARKR